MYDSILVPVDGSEPAEAAAETAVQLANTTEADLSILAVLEPSYDATVDPVSDRPVRDNLGGQWLRALSRVEATADDSGVSYQTTVETGTVHEEIEARVDETDADLVAMGTRGRTGLDRLLLGSVAERALRSLDVPVLAHPGHDASGTVEDVLVPTDGSQGSAQATEQACALAAACEATVHALSVIDVKSLAAVGRGGIAITDVVNSIEKLCERDVEAVREKAENRDVEFESNVVEGAPERAICDYADERDADLIAMGTHGREGVKRFFLGSVTERTVRENEVPVLAIPMVK